MKKETRTWIIVVAIIAIIFIIAVWVNKREEMGRITPPSSKTANTPTQAEVANLDLSTRQRIFYELVKLQDYYSEHYPFNTQKQLDAYKEIAKKFSIPESDVTKIAKEGAQKRWPTPEPK